VKTILSKALLVITATMALVGCAGKVSYAPPTPETNVKQSAVINTTQDIVWKTMIKNLSKNFYVINNIDKESGLINVSYASDPEAVIDCGHITSYVKNAQGARTYDFPAAKASETYEIMDMNYGLFFVERRMSVDGRANIIVQPVDSNNTSVSVSARYVVTKTLTQRNVSSNIPSSFTDTVNFNSSGSATFAEGGTTCHATGKLESDILASAN